MFVENSAGSACPIRLYNAMQGTLGYVLPWSVLVLIQVQVYCPDSAACGRIRKFFQNRQQQQKTRAKQRTHLKWDLFAETCELKLYRLTPHMLAVIQQAIKPLFLVVEDLLARDLKKVKEKRTFFPVHAPAARNLSSLHLKKRSNSAARSRGVTATSRHRHYASALPATPRSP